MRVLCRCAMFDDPIPATEDEGLPADDESESEYGAVLENHGYNNKMRV